MSRSWERLRAVRTGSRSKSATGRLSIAVCAAPSRLATLTRALLRMGSFRPPPEAAPKLPLPHVLAVMPLDEGPDLEVIGIPLDVRFSPMWPLALSRATIAVRLDNSAELSEACAVVGVLLVDAAELAPTFTEEDEEQVAALLHAAAERV
jgi:hypothetical protein